MSAENGVGTLNGAAKELSRQLGNELDLSCAYSINDKASVTLAGGYFFPGAFYKEERDDTAGSLGTPFIRGDGNANGAYQVEAYMELNF